MGDAQSAQREGKQDAAAEEESGKQADHAQTEQNIEDKVGFCFPHGHVVDTHYCCRLHMQTYLQ